MRFSTFIAVGFLSSVAAAASVSIIPYTSLPADAPTIGFTDLTATYSSPLATYTALDLTITATKIWSYSNFYYYDENGKGTEEKSVAHLEFFGGPTPLFSFSQDVRQIAFKEVGPPLNSVTLFADAAGTQPLGTFDTTHAFPRVPLTQFAFQSDVPFRSFSANMSGGSMTIDDLRYSAVPEPTAIAAVGLVVAAAGLRRRRA